MKRKCQLEQLREILKTFKYDAQYLYQYGKLTSSIEPITNLGKNDIKRLMALAIIEGDEDIRSVARVIRDEYIPKLPFNLDKILILLNQKDREEIQEIIEEQNAPKSPAELEENDKKRIIFELNNACEKIGGNEIEEAYWILLSKNDNYPAHWINAMGAEGTDIQFGSSFEVKYHPDKQTLSKLLGEMHKAKVILHIHNHPAFFLDIGSFIPSNNDLGFASQWKSIRPEIGRKMMFFVIQKNIAIEYAHSEGKLIQWI